MLKRLVVKNFQGLKKVAINLHPRITTIVGRTDRGKSAIVRALRTIAINRPPKTYLRRGAATARVSLVTENARVVRAKGKVNYYQVGDQKYKAFGAKVPEAVSNALGITEANFQFQHDVPFWFSDSPGEVSRQLNRIINLQVIDRALSIAASRVRAADAEEASTRQRLTAATAEMRQLEWVPRLEADWGRLQRQHQRHDAATSQRARLTQIVRQLKQNGTYIDRVRLAACDAATVCDLGARSIRDAEQAAALQDLVQALTRVNATLAKGAPDLSQLASLVDAHQEVERERLALTELITTYQTLEDARCHNLKELVSLKQKLKTCPVCGSPIK